MRVGLPVGRSYQGPRDVTEDVNAGRRGGTGSASAGAATSQLFVIPTSPIRSSSVGFVVDPVTFLVMR